LSSNHKKGKTFTKFKNKNPFMKLNKLFTQTENISIQLLFLVVANTKKYRKQFLKNIFD
jgi:hypothetical protein